MTTGGFERHQRPASPPDLADDGGVDNGPHSEHSGWMMLACCVPMLLIAGALVVTGVAGAGIVLVAVGCTLMMYLMMRGMGQGTGGRDV